MYFDEKIGIKNILIHLGQHFEAFLIFFFGFKMSKSQSYIFSKS